MTAFVLPKLVLAACPPCSGHGEVGCGACDGTGLGSFGDDECTACAGAGTKACEACGGNGERDVSAWIVPAIACARCGESLRADERRELVVAWVDEHASCVGPL